MPRPRRCTRDEPLRYVELLYALRRRLLPSDAEALTLGLRLIAVTRSATGEPIAARLTQHEPARATLFVAGARPPYEVVAAFSGEVAWLRSSGALGYPEVWAARALNELISNFELWPLRDVVEHLESLAGANTTHRAANRALHLAVLRDAVPAPRFEALTSLE